MEKGNVLVIGNSGVGKSTLINAVLGEQKAKTGWGTTGTSSKLEIYEPTSPEVPFRVIDTIGFEPTLMKEWKAIHAVRQWSKESAKAGKQDTQINVIWFCVEGTSSKLFGKDIERLTQATALWPSVPIIVAITKSYSEPERERNIEMVRNAFAEQKRYAGKLRAVIPVVAEIYQINDTAFAPTVGLEELICKTNELMPEGLQAAEKDIAKVILDRKRVYAQSIVAASTVAAATVGATPIPIADALILAPLEMGEVNAIARVYGIKKDEKSKNVLNSIVEVGTVGAAAKMIISAIKAIPGINIAASVLNAVIAGVIVAGLGEASIYIFEQIYLGKKTLDDIDWIKKIVESKLAGTLIEKLKPYLERIAKAKDKKEIVAILLEAIPALFRKKED